MGKVLVLSFSDEEEEIYQRMLRIISNNKNFEWLNMIQNKNVIHIGELTVILENCTGTFYITDIMFQEGKWLTGYVVNNLELLQKNRVDGEITPVRFFNGIVRSSVTAVITNDGEVSAGLNYHIIPKDTMAAGDMSVAHNYGSHKLTLQSVFLEDDVVEINADARVATRNGSRIRADGFYSYSAAGDSKHQIKVKDRKSALVRMSFQEMAYGIGGKRI